MAGSDRPAQKNHVRENMFAGIAAGLLVFTGVWHATEWLMDGRRRDTWMLVPSGILFLVLGLLIVCGAGAVVQAIALLASACGAVFAYTRRDMFDIRKWVTWTFIVLDVLIVLCLLMALLG